MARKAVAAKILEKDPDLAFLEEVEGLGSLTEFNKNYLSSSFRPIIVKGNDERGIEIGILIKRDVPLDIEILSNANRTFQKKIKNATEEIYSRDAPLVLLRKKGANPNDPPLLALLGAHLKSQRDSPLDPKSVIKRTEQAKTNIQIKNEWQKKFPGLPIIMSGDFNADLRTAQEFAPFWQDGFKDAFELSPNPLPAKDRITHTYHPKDGPTQNSQLDGILISKEGAGFVKSAGIIPYRNASGQIIPIPTTFAERSQNPSDHFPIFVTIDMDKLLKASGQTPY